MRKYSSIYIYIYGYINRVPPGGWQLTLVARELTKFHLHTHTHTRIYVCVCCAGPLNVSSHVFINNILAQFLVNIILFVVARVCVCALTRSGSLILCYLFILPASFGSQVPKGKYCAYAACVRPSAKSISDCPTNTMYIQLRVSMCVCLCVQSSQNWTNRASGSSNKKLHNIWQHTFRK